MDGMRHLRGDERPLLDYLVSPDRRGREPLREQARQALVITSSLWLIELWGATNRSCRNRR
jgi:hypothetical protein